MYTHYTQGQQDTQLILICYVYSLYPGATRHTANIDLLCILIIPRGNKTHMNRQYRQAVTGNMAKSSSRQFSDISRVHCEEVLVDVQLCTGCVLWMCEGGEQLADYVVTMTKAISESHYRWVA